MKYYLILFFISISFVGMCQNFLLTKAEVEYSRFEYSSAINSYEVYKKKNTLDTASYKKLAISYTKVRDSKNAERIFREMSMPTSTDKDLILLFAEVLSQNGKYNEAQVYFKKYSLYDMADERGFKNTHKNLHNFYQDSSLYEISILDINSSQSDFSPTYYENGIVFSSGRSTSGIVKRVYTWDNSAFLDLYYVDTAGFKNKKYFTDIGKDSLGNTSISNLSMYHYDETLLTSNDTRTLGYFGANFYNDSSWSLSGNGTKPVPFSKKLNTKYHEGPVCFSQDGNTIFFTRNSYYKGQVKKSEENVNNLKIFTAVKNSKGKWGKIKPLPFNNHDYSVGHPMLSSDGKTLFFASNMPGGYGGTDLYKSTMGSDGIWGTPQNLGDVVNTKGDELFPFCDSLNYMYFSSTGFEGLGGLDIFVYDLTQPATAPFNLGYPVNSKKDDFGIITDKDGLNGFFSSNRRRTGTDDDLFSFKKTPKITLNAFAFSSETKDTLNNFLVKIYEITKSGDSIAIDGTHADNLYTYRLDPNKEYHIEAFNADGISNKESGNPTTDGTGGATRDGTDGSTTASSNTTNSNKPLSSKSISTHKVRDRSILNVGVPIDMAKLKQDSIQNNNRIDNIYYDLDKYSIRQSDLENLSKVLAFMQQHPNATLIVSSHTDSRASKEYNELLSKRRSEAVFQWLVLNNIQPDRIIQYYYGETILVNKCSDEDVCDEAAHQMNRRTEFSIVLHSQTVLKK